MRCLLLSALACIITFTGSEGRLPAQSEDNADINREHQIKAAYLFQFGRYVEWPAKAFTGPDAPFVIGVLDQDPIAANLEEIARVKKIQDRPILIRRFSSADDIRACNILYLSSRLAPEIQAEVMRRLAGHGTLLVGDSNGFLERGGVMRFSVESNNIRVIVARKAAEREGLKISAKLLQVARVVE